MAAPQIGEYALLSDCHSAALVAADGSVDWWPAPRFDSPSILGRVLDPDAGVFALGPAGGGRAHERRYVAGSLVLESVFRAGAGELVVRDALALAPGAREHGIGLRSPHALVRLAEARGGPVDVEVEAAIRPEYGLVVPELVPHAGGLDTIGGPQRLRIEASRPVRIDGTRARASFRLAPGERAGVVLRLLEGGDDPEPLDPAATIADTVAGWRSWTDMHGADEGPFSDAVACSSAVIQGLTYAPTGGIVAAPTTSLPERIGGDRNYDYRYAWLRDASLVGRALVTGTCSDEAARYFRFMAEAAVTCRESDHVQIVFGVGGERFLEETELDHLRGYRDSRPVRVGNAAWRQKQLDVLGEVLDVALLVRDELAGAGPHVRPLLRQLAGRAARQWREPDAGPWEDRTTERHHVLSKVMCWVALDRALTLGPLLGAAGDETSAWRRERDAVRDAVLAHGWSDDRGAFTEAFGSDRLDASALLLPLVGFLPADDPRMESTVRRIEAELVSGGLVHRLGGADEFEGAFLPTTLWLADCHARAGRPGRAREIVERVLALGGDLGLLAEQADPTTGEALGNHPQALSHIALVNAAEAIATAERGSAPVPA